MNRTVFPRTVIVLGFVSLLTDVASEMCVPLFPLLVASFGSGPALLGLMEGAADALSALIKGPAGALSDRAAGRKRLILAGYTLAAVARPLQALASAPLHSVAARLLDRAGKGLRSAPRDALLADASPAHQRAAVFGFHRGMDHVGACIGPLVAAAVLWQAPTHSAVRWTLAASLLPALCAVLLIACCVRDGARAPLPNLLPADRPETLPGARLLLAAMAVFATFKLQELLLLSRLQQWHVPAHALPLFWSALHLVKSLSASPLGQLADRIGHTRALALGYGLAAAGMLLVGHAGNAPALLATSLVFSLHHGLTEGVERALIARAYPPARRGRGFGVYHAVTSLLMLPSGFAQGIALDRLGMDSLCTLLSTGSLLACGLATMAASWRRAGGSL